MRTLTGLQPYIKITNHKKEFVEFSLRLQIDLNKKLEVEAAEDERKNSTGELDC
jgi:hypothetical protein